MKVDPRQIEVIDDQVADILRSKTPEEKLRIGSGIWRSARRMLLSHITNIHPDWSIEEVEKEVARRLLRGAL